MNSNANIGEKLANDLDGQSDLSLGKEYVFYTMTYHHQGILVMISEFYGEVMFTLENSLMINESGSLEEYYKTKIPQSADKQGRIKIPFHSVTHIKELQ